MNLNINFNNTYSSLPEQFYERINPEHFAAPKLIVFNQKLATELNIGWQETTDQELAEIFSGNKILPGSEPLAQAYAGFQFGNLVPQLGDGRAHLLGEVAGFDIQLKGSGQTRFSRRGDGRSALGPVLREYIVSEAMHVLGVPTTRSLCAVSTGEEVYRQDGPEPGGILTRVAKSHIRVGTFQYFAFKNDLESLEALLNYTIDRHYPELAAKNKKDQALGLIDKLIELQSDLIAQWTSLGFIHGVMNTDNFSMAGITIDYGPCAFLDEFKFDKVFSSIDRHGRYSFFNQVPIAKWNIFRLAECFIPFIDENTDQAIALLEKNLGEPLEFFDFKRMKALAKKMGISDYQTSDEKLVTQFLEYLEKESLDFTLAFRELKNLYHSPSDFFPKSQEFDEFQSLWKNRVKNVDELDQINPLYIPRNHLIQKAIDEAYTGNFDFFHRLNEVLTHPFSEKTECEEFALPPKPSERVYQTFCGT
ncbi:MAG: hypothetical protein CME62_06050 [Halobacteriovoraceae bacterium]|nr:hypothetical protein [Halobacteriovoraceae bacterium]|tara:strand:+ start:6475 stop:7902 length:1428 start_codon:yes stop_codon:yes gene_type:complete